MACTKTRDGGCTCSHAHCTLCGKCLTCSPHPPHTDQTGAWKKPKR